MFIYEVFVTNASLNVNQLYSYYSDEYIDSFCRVEVLFAKSKTSALVINRREINDLSYEENKLGFKLSRIIGVIDEEPIISLEQYELALWMSKITISPFIVCLNTMLPKTLRTSKLITGPKYIEKIHITGEIKALTKRQKEVYDSLYEGMKASDGRRISVSVFNRLLEYGMISLYKDEASYVENNRDVIDDKFKELTSEQNDVYKNVLDTDKTVFLLFGVTGSGKTEVYLHLAREYISKGKDVLILVPEISLTPQMIQRVKERFSDVIFYHSELNDQERYEQYKRVKEGKTRIVVGTRSSVFLPFNNLGLIIMDEEHDNSYKQDNTPCYNAKSIAIKRAMSFNAKVLLASATPSLDSYTRALKNEYQLLTLKNRINHSIPDIEIVDLTEEIKNKSSFIISNRLKTSIEIELNNNKQVIILLNRRGYSPIIKCSECGTTLMCSDCDAPLNYHKDENILKCHICSKNYRVPKYCPKCGKNSLLYYGFGTKRVEEELKSMFPNASIERMDRDNVSRKGSHSKILQRFEKKEIDILIGTQMIAKGLDYPDVTLVGILNADAGLAHQDYNAAKLTFDLLMQASGRSGRASSKGKVIIQAFNPDHYVLKAVLSQDYIYFYNIEMNYRSKTSYPPYSHLLEIILSDSNFERINNSLAFFENKLKNLSYKQYRPVEIGRIKGDIRYRILLANKDINPMIDSMWYIIDEYLKTPKLAKIKIDIDPLYLE